MKFEFGSQGGKEGKKPSPKDKTRGESMDYLTVHHRDTVTRLERQYGDAWHRVMQDTKQGRSLNQACIQLGMSKHTWYKLRAKYREDFKRDAPF